jgi:hypothetical protein
MKQLEGISLRQWAGRMVALAASVLVLAIGAHALLSGHAAMAPPLVGVDVSHFNPGLDVAQAKAQGISFTFIKATQGTTYDNPDFASDRKNAVNGGLVVGAYHFLNPSSSSSPASQCTHYLDSLNATGGTAGIMLGLDVELQTSTTGPSYQDVKDFLAACQAKTPGRTWIIYTGGWYWGNSKQAGYLHNPAAPAGTLLWISIYVSGTGSALDLLTKVGAQGTSGDPYVTSQINGWPEYTFRQYSSTATVANLSPLDVDVTYKGIEYLRTLAGLSAQLPCTAVPSAPGGFAATSTTTTAASLTWTASVPGANCTLSGYRIWRSVGTTAPPTTGTPLTTVTGLLNYSDATVTAGTTYTYAIAAYDSAGHISPTVSKTVTVPTTPPPVLPGDANNDGRVNALDLSLVISHDGQNYPPADFNKDGTVGAADLAILLSKWTW